jgi:hypothetical protein
VRIQPGGGRAHPIPKLQDSFDLEHFFSGPFFRCCRICRRTFVVVAMGNSTSDASSDCPAGHSQSYVEGLPVSGSLSFRDIILIVCWVCFGVSILLWLALVIPHLRRYNAPNQQRQIFRIISLPVIFEAITIASVYAYHVSDYLEPIPNLFEAFALASLFLLYVHYVAPEAHTREEFFESLDRISSNGEVVPGGSLRWFRVSRIRGFEFAV